MSAEHYIPYKTNPNRRLSCENVDFTLDIGKGHHDLTVSLAYDNHNALREVCFVGRGRATELDFILHDLGIKLSRVIQARDPNGSQFPVSGDWETLLESAALDGADLPLLDAAD